ncbi:unnamed protein product [Candidula unifasciata]|uniref:Transmembrane protein 192 n=1 Tax=Candidula unifasciata TaxID=100452 RepID=A0A8S3ZE85_9EUPU|nr:unnamed protein product [Candidula unifasciata]
MVSLSNDRLHSGGYFGFSDDHAANSDDDLIVDHIELVSGPEITHRPMNISWAIILTDIIYVGLVISAYLIPVQCDDTDGACGEDPLSLTMYIHGGMWFILFAVDRYLQHKHDQSRLYGYLDFYRQTRNLRRMPLFINSCANALLVIVMRVLDSHCDSKGNCKFLNKTHYIQILISFECMLALVILLVYLVHVMKFNFKKALPDITLTGLTASYESLYLSSDVGLRNASGYCYEVMEKQADMIRYLQQHTEMLARRNLTLTDEVNRLKSLRQNGPIQ